MRQLLVQLQEKKKNPLIDSPLASTLPSVIQPDKDPDVR